MSESKQVNKHGASVLTMRSIIFIWVLLLLTGCGDSKLLMIENGFAYASHSQGFPDRNAWAGLVYQDPTGKITGVWGCLSPTSPCIQITNKLAVFAGGVYDDGTQGFTERLIAFEAPEGPRMDITEQILQKYCKQSGVNRTNVVQDSFASLIKTNDSLQITFSLLTRRLTAPYSLDDSLGIALVSWRDIETIMADVKKTGKIKKEKWSGVEYLQKEIEPSAQP